MGMIYPLLISFILLFILPSLSYAEQYNPPTTDTMNIQDHILLIELNQRVNEQKKEINELKGAINDLRNSTQVAYTKIEILQQRIINNQKKDYLLMGIISLISGLVGYIIAFMTMRKLYLYAPKVNKG